MGRHPRLWNFQNGTAKPGGGAGAAGEGEKCLPARIVERRIGKSEAVRGYGYREETTLAKAEQPKGVACRARGV